MGMFATGYTQLMGVVTLRVPLLIVLEITTGRETYLSDKGAWPISVKRVCRAEYCLREFDYWAKSVRRTPISFVLELSLFAH